METINLKRQRKMYRRGATFLFKTKITASRIGTKKGNLTRKRVTTTRQKEDCKNYKQDAWRP